MMMMRLTTARACSFFGDDVDEVCWICLDGDTEGREVRRRERSRRESTRRRRVGDDDVGDDDSTIHASTEQRKTRAKHRISDETGSRFFDWKKSYVYGTKKLLFSKKNENILGGDLV